MVSLSMRRTDARPVRQLSPRSGTADARTPIVDTDISVRSAALTVLAFAATMYLLSWAQEAFIPIVLSILISYALEPVVAMFTRAHLPRILAAALVVAATGGALGYGMYALSDDVTAIVAQLPEAAQKLRRVMQRDGGAPNAIEHVERAAQELQKTADQASVSNPAPKGVTRVQVEEPTINVRQYITWGSASLVAFAGQATLVFFFVFFLLASGDLFKRKLVKLAGPSLEKKKITVQILDDINRQIARFLFVRVTTSVVVGVVTWIAFWAVGLEQAALWGALAGIFNSVPYFGPVIVAGATAVVAFLQFGTVAMAAYVSGISLAITSVEGWLLTPWLTSRTARTNEVAIFVGLIFWSFVWGLWGTLLAVPMLVTLKAYCDHIDDLKPVGELLAE
jgi:predicted PurR-regulated permease PerM